MLPLVLFLNSCAARVVLIVLWFCAYRVRLHGPSFGTGLPHHIAGFLFGMVFALFTRAAIARRLRHSRGY